MAVSEGMEDIRTSRRRTRSPTTGRNCEIQPDGTVHDLMLRPKTHQSSLLPSTVEESTPPQRPVPARKPVPTVAELTARLDALEQEYRQYRQRFAVPGGKVAIHGTVPGSGTMRRAGEIFAMQPVNREGLSYEEQ